MLWWVLRSVSFVGSRETFRQSFESFRAKQAQASLAPLARRRHHRRSKARRHDRPADRFPGVPLICAA